MKDCFDSAYEEVVYRDSTDDGNQGAVWEDEDATHDELLQRIQAGRRPALVPGHRRPALAAFRGQPDSGRRRAG